MSILTNSEWYDSDGRYVPLSDREYSENDVFSRIFDEMDNVCEYTQIGGYLHVFTNKEPTELRDIVEQKHGSIRVTVRDRHEHTYRYIPSKNVVVLEFTAT